MKGPLPPAFIRILGQVATAIRLSVFYIVYQLTAGVRNSNRWAANAQTVWAMYPYTPGQSFFYWLCKVCLHEGRNWCVRSDQLFLGSDKRSLRFGSACPPIRQAYTPEYFGERLERMDQLLTQKYPGSGAHASGVLVEKHVAYDLYNQGLFGLDVLLKAEEVGEKILLPSTTMGARVTTLHLSAAPLYWEGW